MSPNISKGTLAIDVENIASRYFSAICEEASAICELLSYFASGKETSFKNWDKTILGYPFKKVVAPIGKDIADSIIIMRVIDILVNQPEIETFCIATDNKDFAPLGKVLLLCGKRVIFMGTAKAAKILQTDFEFIMLKKPITKNQ